MDNSELKRSTLYNLCLEKGEGNFYSISDRLQFQALVKELELREDEEIEKRRFDQESVAIFQLPEKEFKKSKIGAERRDYAVYLTNIARKLNRLLLMPKNKAIIDPRKIDVRKQIFLSYAYDDKALTIGLYEYFLRNSSYLYVDWMHNGKQRGGKAIEQSLLPPLHRSTQLLFMLTPNSEFFARGTPYIRSWCSWEIGEFIENDSCKIDKEFYLTYKDTPSIVFPNGILDAMRPFYGLKNGECF